MDLELGTTAFRDFAQLKERLFNDEKVSTVTSREQQKTEHSVEKCYDRFHQLQYMTAKIAKFNRAEHQRYLESMLHRLPTSYECLDSSRPWNVYWILQAAHLLNFSFSDETLEHVVQFLTKCRHADGGFAGGPGQYPHLAPTYAAVNSLCIIGTPSAYCAIDRDSLMRFLFSVREPDGSFRLHVDGETDVRGAYCAISCAKLTNVPAATLSALFDKTGDWIASCQTYEGGFGGAPDLEAHGGYTFCGIAALALLNEGHKCDKQQLLKWNLQRQMSYEGGFQGRTNKLVDGCYSFWVGATIPITQAIIANEVKQLKQSLFDVSALQEYILLCCQKPSGGLIDKPGKPQDLYHTCYTLSGVAIAQHSESTLNPQVLGEPVNELLPTHPLFNVPPRVVAAALQHFEYFNEAKERSCDRNGTSTGTNDNSEHGSYSLASSEGTEEMDMDETVESKVAAKNLRVEELDNDGDEQDEEEAPSVSSSISC